MEMVDNQIKSLTSESSWDAYIQPLKDLDLLRYLDVKTVEAEYRNLMESLIKDKESSKFE
jgi:hypothetical protein